MNSNKLEFFQALVKMTGQGRTEVSGAQETQMSTKGEVWRWAQGEAAF